MAVWLEIRCDVRNTGVHCYSNQNNGPMALAEHRGVLKRAAELEKQALSEGWKRIQGIAGYGLSCPACAKGERHGA